MNLSQALERANAISIPGLVADEGSLDAERRQNEEAIALLREAWVGAPAGKEPFSFDMVRSLADRNRALCDRIGEARLRDAPGLNLARRLSDASLVAGVAALQGRRPAAVRKTAGRDLSDLGIAYLEAPVRGTVLGVDIETTSRNPDRGYVINLGLAFMELASGATPHDAHAAYFGIPDLYEATGVPLARIHHITWADLAGKTPFREDARAQRALLRAFESVPIMAHNAAFEDSWFMLQLDGYAEARKAGKVVVVDSRDICRRLDSDYRSLPHDSHPAALENWARRRSTLRPDESERHLGLEDVFLMLDTVREEFSEHAMLPGQRQARGQ